MFVRSLSPRWRTTGSVSTRAFHGRHKYYRLNKSVVFFLCKTPPHRRGRHRRPRPSNASPHQTQAPTAQTRSGEAVAVCDRASIRPLLALTESQPQRRSASTNAAPPRRTKPLIPSYSCRTNARQEYIGATKKKLLLRSRKREYANAATKLLLLLRLRLWRARQARLLIACALKSNANHTPPIAPQSPRPFPHGGKGGTEPATTATDSNDKKGKIRKIKSKEKKMFHKPPKKFMEHAILFSATRAFEFTNATKHLYFVAFAHARIKRDRRNKIIVLLAFA